MALPLPGVDCTTPQHTTSLLCQLLRKSGLSSNEMVKAWQVPPLPLLWGYSLATNGVQSHLCIMKLEGGMYCKREMEMLCFIPWGHKLTSHSCKWWPKAVWHQPDNLLSFKECLDQTLDLQVLRWFRTCSKWDFSSSPKLCNSIKILRLNSPGLREVHAGA